MTRPKKIVLDFCRENSIEIKLSYNMPAGYETAYGTYDVCLNTLFLNSSLLQDAPGYEVLFYLFHELRHALQYLRPELFDRQIRESIDYVILYNGTCYKLVENQWRECVLEGAENYFTRAYMSLPYEIDANTFAYEETKRLLGDMPELRELFEFWTPREPFDWEEHRKLFRRIDEKLLEEETYNEN